MMNNREKRGFTGWVASMHVRTCGGGQCPRVFLPKIIRPVLMLFLDFPGARICGGLL